MPIVIKDFTWNQAKDKIAIKVPIRGANSSKADIFTSPRYIKMTLEKLFFEVILLHEVDGDEIVCTKTPGEVIFDLTKCSEEMWESLEVTDLTKQEKNELKRKFIQDEHERIQKVVEAKIGRKAELKRVAVNEQIELDTRTRSRIENIKKMEETKAMGDLNQWKMALETTHQKTNKTKIIEIDDSDTDNKVNHQSLAVKEIKKKSTGVKNRATPIPKVRSTRSLQVLFTPREFPTPSRESRLEEEKEYLRKQAEARRTAGFVSEDLRPEEKNPQYLLAKGREFLRNQNYLGAISAFSFGIKLNPKFLDLYLARSEAHIAVGNFKRSVDDCTSALEIMRPALPINLEQRALCVGRRGIALFKLGFLKHGMAELECSLKMKESEEFRGLLEECRLEFERVKEQEKEQKEKEAKAEKK